MKHNLIIVCFCFFLLFLVGCTPQSTPSIDPTSTIIPTNQIAPSATPTMKPSPSRTPIPFATFKGCIYSEGEKVNGSFTFFDENGDFIPELQTQVPSGCATIHLTPGYYAVHANYFKGPICGTLAGCFAAMDPVEIMPNQVIEMDFEVSPFGG